MAEDNSTNLEYPITVCVYKRVFCWDGYAQFERLVTLPFLPFRGLYLIFRENDDYDHSMLWAPEAGKVKTVSWSIERDALWVDLQSENHTRYEFYGDTNCDPSLTTVIAHFEKAGWSVHSIEKGVTKAVEQSLNEAGFFKVPQNGKAEAIKKAVRKRPG